MAITNLKLFFGRLQFTAYTACAMAGVLLLIASQQLLAADSQHIVQSDPLTPQEQLKKFHLPPGFEIQLVAAEPDVQKPINLNFDHRGRLFFSQSVEYPFPAKDTAKARDTIRVIEGIGDDGSAGKVSVAIGGLNIPLGVIPIGNSVIAYSIPDIAKYTDTDGDGTYEHREKLFGPFDFRDTHGMNNSFTRGLDGWIYACHGFANESTVAGKDGHKITLQSGNTYRFRPDGSRIEKFTHGQVNPFGLCFDPQGNLYSSDCHTLPCYQLLRGAHYPSFGKPDDGLGFGPTMVSHSHGSTGIAGIVYYAAKHFPREYRNTIFIGNPITHKVNHDRLKWNGATPVGIEQPDFLTCDDPWFRPVDLKLGPDGALYIADFYNRIIGHYEVPLDHPGRDRERGRIWRVVYKGTKDTPAATASTNDVNAAKITSSDLSALDMDQLLVTLSDGNLTVRTMATHEIVDRFGAKAAGPLKKLLLRPETTPAARTHGLRALEALRQLDDGLIERLLTDLDSIVRVHLIKALAERSDWGNTSLKFSKIFVAKLEDKDPAVRSAAADALARHPQHEQISALLSCIVNSSADDTHLMHTLKMALRDHLRQPGAYAYIAGDVLTSRSDAQRHLVAASLGVPSEASATFVLNVLQSPSGHTIYLTEGMKHLARYLSKDDLPQVKILFEELPQLTISRRQELLLAFHRGLQARGLSATTDLRPNAIELTQQLLKAKDEGERGKGIELASELKLIESFDKLKTIVATGSSVTLRTAAIDAIVACDATRSVEPLSQLLSSSGEPIQLRQKSAQALSGMNSESAGTALLTQLPLAPRSLAVEIATGLANRRETAARMVGLIEAGKASPQLLNVNNVKSRLNGHNRKELNERIAKLTEGLSGDDEGLRKLINDRLAGLQKSMPNDADAAAISAVTARGKQVFSKHCAACHKIDGEGNKIGPELDGIRHRGAERLIEDILSPGLNVDQAFRSTTITTKDGLSISGLALREEGEILVLADNQGKEVRVPTGTIDERKVSAQSPMPANVAELTSEAEFYDLLRFLLQTRAVPAMPKTK